MRTRSISLVSVISTLVCLAEAHAGDVYTMVAGGCVPFASSIQNDLYDNGFFGVKNQIAGTAVQMVCPVTYKTATTWKAFEATTSDPDGTGTTYDIEVSLKYHDVGTNTTTNICTVASSSYSSGVQTPDCNFTDFTPVAGRFYFFYVEIQRETPSASVPEFLSVRITD